METDVLVEPILGVCNLCLSDCAVKSMILTSDDHGTYADLLTECFCIDLANFQLGDTKPVICASCINQLEITMQFRKKVETSLQILEEAFRKSLSKLELDPDAMDNCFDGGFDSYPEAEVEVGPYLGAEPEISETIKKEELPEAEIEPESTHHTREKPSKTLKKYKKLNIAKRPNKKSLLETETLLKNGLFPFKLKRNNTFACAICSEKSSNLDDIKKHVNEHPIKYIHVAFKKMLNNMQRFYKCDDRLCCKLCLKYMHNYDDLKLHINSCNRLFSGNGWNMLPFKLEKDQTQCPICNQVFLNFVNLNSHMNEHYPNYICENCGKAFASKGRLRGHVRTHEIGEFSCKYCELVFDKVTKRENHVSKEHKSGVRYACKRCKISLPSFYARQKHLADVHNEELKRYKCKACEQSYITPGHLSSHVRRDHLNERNHKCSKCDLAFYSRNALKMHMIKHDGERIHTCPVCQKSYQRKKTLREHLRIHDNDKRFTCPVCSRAFTQKCTLKGHMRVHKDQTD